MIHRYKRGSKIALAASITCSPHSLARHRRTAVALQARGPHGTVCSQPGRRAGSAAAATARKQARSTRESRPCGYLRRPCTVYVQSAAAATVEAPQDVSLGGLTVHIRAISPAQNPPDRRLPASCCSRVPNRPGGYTHIPVTIGGVTCRDCLVISVSPSGVALYTIRRDQASDKGEDEARGLRRLIEPG